MLVKVACVRDLKACVCGRLFGFRVLILVLVIGFIYKILTFNLSRKTLIVNPI